MSKAALKRGGRRKQRGEAGAGHEQPAERNRNQEHGQDRSETGLKIGRITNVQGRPDAASKAKATGTPEWSVKTVAARARKPGAGNGNGRRARK